MGPPPRPTGGAKKGKKSKMTEQEQKDFDEKVKNEYATLCATLVTALEKD